MYDIISTIIIGIYMPLKKEILFETIIQYATESNKTILQESMIVLELDCSTQELETCLENLKNDNKILYKKSDKGIYNIEILINNNPTKIDKNINIKIDNENDTIIDYFEKKLYTIFNDICIKNSKYEIKTKVKLIDIVEKGKLKYEDINFASTNLLDIVLFKHYKNKEKILFSIEFDFKQDKLQNFSNKIKNDICKENNIPIIKIKETDELSTKSILLKLIKYKTENIENSLETNFFDDFLKVINLFGED